MGKYDLHIHSTCSDGEKDVMDIIRYAKENDFNMISITDHDDVESIEKVKTCEFGNIKVIPGNENDINLLEIIKEERRWIENM